MKWDINIKLRLRWMMDDGLSWDLYVSYVYDMHCGRCDVSRLQMQFVTDNWFIYSHDLKSEINYREIHCQFQDWIRIANNEFSTWEFFFFKFWVLELTSFTIALKTNAIYVDLYSNKKAIWQICMCVSFQFNAISIKLNFMLILMY